MDDIDLVLKNAEEKNHQTTTCIMTKADWEKWYKKEEQIKNTSQALLVERQRRIRSVQRNTSNEEYLAELEKKYMLSLELQQKEKERKTILQKSFFNPINIKRYVSPDDFCKKWDAISYNSGQMADKAMKKYRLFLNSMGETETTMFEKLGEIKGSEDFYLFLNRIVEYFGESLHPRSVRAYFSFVKDYYRKNGFRIYNEDIKQFIDMPKVIKEKKVPFEKEDIKLLADHASPYLRGVIYCLASSGMRTTEFLMCKHSDFKWNLDPVEVHLRAEITKTKVDRITYLSPQAVEHFPKIKPYSEKNSLISIEQAFARLRKKCNRDTKYRTSNVHHITPHRLRPFFKTEASNMHGKDYAEDLVGHEGYLSTYYVINDELRKEKYKQLIPKITI